MKFFRNLLPKDTLATELTSSAILLISLMLMLFGFDSTAIHESILVTMCVVPLTHLFCLISGRYKVLRTYCSLHTGALMVYMSFLHLSDYSFISFISVMVLGFSNLYAFILNNQGEGNGI